MGHEKSKTKACQIYVETSEKWKACAVELYNQELEKEPGETKRGLCKAGRGGVLEGRQGQDKDIKDELLTRDFYNSSLEIKEQAKKKAEEKAERARI